VDRLGPYPAMLDVDAWDESRDARAYAGPLPVIAHPPCGAWSSLRHLSQGAHADCGPIAVEQVRKHGGVLEQPAGSKLWEHCKLPNPGWECVPMFGSRVPRGFSVEVCQVSWGHVARKRTWLYFVGVDRELVERGIRVGGTPTHWVSGARNQMRKNGRVGGGAVPPGIKVCSAEQRRRTPVAFAEWLVSIAREAVVS
jgi:hypothetical protein